MMQALVHYTNVKAQQQNKLALFIKIYAYSQNLHILCDYDVIMKQKQLKYLKMFAYNCKL